MAESTVDEVVFDFVEDHELRVSLEEDQRELVACILQNANKAAHVLAGSIVEAMLLDGLLVVRSDQQARAKLLQVEFSELIRLAQEEKLIKARTADLCSVVRSYRNLVHPSRAKRLEDSISASSARIAGDLVSLIAGEVAVRRRAQMGPTPSQVVRKLRTDQHAGAIVGSLIDEMSTANRRLFLLRVCETAILEIGNEERGALGADGLPPASNPADPNDLGRQKQRVIEGWGRAFALAPDSDRREWLAAFASRVRRGTQFEIETIGDAFFTCSHLSWVEGADRELLVAHALSRLTASVSWRTVDMMAGIGPYLDKRNARSFVDPIVVYRSGRSDEPFATLQEQTLVDEFAAASSDARVAIRSRLEMWRSVFENGRAMAKEWVQRMLGALATIELAERLGPDSPPVVPE